MNPPWQKVLLIGMISCSTVAVAQEPASPMGRFQVAGMCVEPRPWDKEHNFKLLTKYAQQAASEGAQLLVTCEGFLDGYISNANRTPELTREKYLQVGEPLDGLWMKRISELADALNLYLSVGFAERRDDQMFNSVVLFAPTGEVALHYSKAHTKGEIFNTPGTGFPIANTELATFGSLICYDRRFPEVPRILALKGAQVLIMPAFGSDDERNEALLVTRAWENSVWVVYVRQDQVLIINPKGRIIARNAGEHDQLVWAEVKVHQAGHGDIRERRPPEFYREIVEIGAEQQLPGR